MIGGPPAGFLGREGTGAAWSSSARAVKCSVDSVSGRNTCRLSPRFVPGERPRGAAGPSRGGDSLRDGEGMSQDPPGQRVGRCTTSDPYGPYAWGCRCGTMVTDRRWRWREPERGRETAPKYGSWTATRPCETGVYSNRSSAWSGEPVLGVWTYRQSVSGNCWRTKEGANHRVRRPTARDGGKVRVRRQ